MIPDFPPYRGLINSIESGCFERCETGLRVHVELVSSHQAVQEFADQLGMTRMTLDSSDFSISTNPDAPTIFTGTRKLQFPAGTLMPDITSGRRVRLPFALSGTVRTEVFGTVAGGVIEGRFLQLVSFDQVLPIAQAEIRGSFKAVVAL
jgi:hypothetical protein